MISYKLSGVTIGGSIFTTDELMRPNPPEVHMLQKRPEVDVPLPGLSWTTTTLLSPEECKPFMRQWRCGFAARQIVLRAFAIRYFEAHGMKFNIQKFEDGAWIGTVEKLPEVS